MSFGDNMTLGQALEICKAGGRVTRRGWNGRDMWVTRSPGHDALLAACFWAGPNREYAERNGGTAKVLPCYTMKTADGSILMGWVASQSDMDATDWEEVTSWDWPASPHPGDRP